MKEIKSKIIELLGESTMCWSPVPSGVFDDEKALDVADRIMSLFDATPILEMKVEDDQLWVRIDTQMSKEKPNMRVLHY